MTSDYSLLVVGLLLCLGGIWERFTDQRKRRREQQWVNSALKTDGVVSRISERKDYSGPSDTYDNISVMKVPVIRFRASNGQDYEFDGPNGVGQVGAKVAVAYNPELPSDARALGSYGYRAGCGFILIAIGLALAVKAIVA